MRVNSIRIEGNSPFRSTIQSSVSLKMENGHLCLFPCFTGLVGDGWIAAHRRRVRRRRATGWTGEQQMVSPCGNPLALRLPGSHGGRTGWASGTPEPMACRSKTPRPSESGTPLCHGAGAALRWEDRRSIPDGCGQHVPGLDGHRVTPLCCELRLRERFTVTDRDRESGLDLDCRVSSLDIFNDIRPYDVKNRQQSIKEAMYRRWKGGHSRMHPLGEGAG